MNQDMTIKQVSEIVAPNNPANKLPFPIGKKFALNNEKAYYFVTCSGSGYGLQVAEKTAELEALTEKRSNDEVTSIEWYKKIHEFVLFNLSLQYNDATIDEIENTQAIDATLYSYILFLVNGALHNYEVEVGKKK